MTFFARSLRAQLVAALMAVLLASFAIAFLLVVPSLEHQLVDARLDELSRALPSIVENYPSDPLAQDSYLEAVSTSTNARVVLLARYGPPLVLRVLGDSRTIGSGSIARDPLAAEAAQTGRAARGTTRRGGVSFAEVAQPSPDGGIVVLLSTPLTETHETVETVQQRLVIAVVPAALVAFLLGSVGARWVARRVGRLERAADRIATGDLAAPVPDQGEDEIGELSRSFERMRVQLAQLEEARRAFIANASHELRTPLFAIGGSLELLVGEEDMSDEERRTFLQRMSDQVERLTRLASDLLDLSRLDAGRLELSEEPLELAELVETLVREFSPAAELEKHPLEAQPQATTALGDEGRLLQVGRTLVENALIHTPAGTRVVVGSGSHEGRPALYVEDDGPGIPDDAQARIFERFFRANGERAAGAGLGLSIARELVERMQGSLELECAGGRTRFVVALRPPFPRENGDEFEPEGLNPAVTG